MKIKNFKSSQELLPTIKSKFRRKWNQIIALWIIWSIISLITIMLAPIIIIMLSIYCYYQLSILRNINRILFQEIPNEIEISLLFYNSDKSYTTLIDVLEEINNNINKVINIRKTSTYLKLNNEFEWIIEKYIKAVYTDIRIIISLIKKELQADIKQKEEETKWAKMEIEIAIMWTTELNQVSELQRARLDKQIEQFEELQRALVKV